MLMAAGLPLPDVVFAHGWLLVGGEKMSKSKLTGIAPSAIIDTFGSDAFATTSGSHPVRIRWVVPVGGHARQVHVRTRQWPGNLASRATAMVVRYCDSVVPEPCSYANADRALQDAMLAATDQADASMVRLDFAGGIAAIRSFVDAVNLYVTEQEPWKLAKDPAQRGRLETVLYTMCEALRAIAVLYNPVMPKGRGQPVDQTRCGAPLGRDRRAGRP